MKKGRILRSVSKRVRKKWKVTGHRESKENSTLAITAPVMIVSITLLMNSLPAFAVVHGDVELLKTVAIQHKTNTEAILTWKGQAVIHDTHKRGESYDRELENVASFAYRHVSPAVRWNMQTTANRFIIAGRDIEDSDTGYNVGMIKNGRFFSYKIRESDKDLEHHNLIIFEEEETSGQMQDFCFDPTYFLTDHYENLTHRLMYLYEHANDPNLGEWFVSRKGSLVTVETRFNGEKKLNRYVFDISNGGNMVSYYATAPDEEEDWKYQFEEKDRVWVLKRLNHTYTCPGSLVVNGAKTMVKTVTTKTIEWVTNILNEPLDPDEFSLSKLGVKPGDWVNDTLMDIRFKYMGAGEEDEDFLLIDLDIDSVPERANSPIENGKPIRIEAEGDIAAKEANNIEGKNIETVPLAQNQRRIYPYVFVAILIGVLLLMITIKLFASFEVRRHQNEHMD